MRKIILYFLVIGCHFPSCSAVDSADFEYKIIKLKINAHDDNFIGYESVSDGPDISINSILVNNGKVFLLDRYFGNIKMVDIVSGQCSTIRVDNSIKWLTDIASIGDLFVISTDLKGVYFFDNSFQYLGNVDLIEGEKYFVGNYKDSLDVYNVLNRNHSFLTLDQKISDGSEDYFNTFDKASLRLNYSYFSNDTVNFISFSTNDTIQLKTIYPEDFKKSSEGVNMDFDGNHLVYYQLDTLSENLLLHVYSRK